MAHTRDFPAHSQKVLRQRATKYLKTLIIPAALVLAASAPPSARAQLQQPLVFSSAGGVASRNDQTGALTPVAGSPFTAANQSLVIDVQGRFLFAIGTNSIRMFQITNSTTGAYQEVACSPFASPNTIQPAFIAVEPSGHYIAVVNRVGQKPGDGSVETFAISPSSSSCTLGGPALTPVLGSATELESTPVGDAQPPNNKEFLIFMGANPASSNSTIAQGSEFQALSIDPQTGFVTGLQANAALPERGDSFAVDPQGRYYVTGTQDNLQEFGIVQLLGIGGDGLLGNVQLPQHNYPVALWIDSTGAFLYVATSNLLNPIVVKIYSVNLQTGALAAAPRSQASVAFHPTSPTPRALSITVLARTQTPRSPLPSIHRPATSCNRPTLRSPFRKSQATSPSTFPPDNKASAVHRLLSRLPASPLALFRPETPARLKQSP